MDKIKKAAGALPLYVRKAKLKAVYVFCHASQFGSIHIIAYPH